MDGNFRNYVEALHPKLEILINMVPVQIATIPI